MKFDFHCHTLKVKTGDPASRTVTAKLFKEKIELSEVKMIAITNHNVFDITNYQKLSETVIDNCIIFPGVEFDVIGPNGSKGHLILVASDKEIVKFKEIVDKVTIGTNPEQFEIKLYDLYDNFNSLDIIYIAHFFKKDQLSLEDLNCFEEYMGINAKRLLKEASNLNSIGVLHSHNHRAIIGSDVKDWNTYEKEILGEMKFEIESFEQLLKLVDKNSQLIDDLIKENFEEIITVYGKNSTKEFPYEIPIFNDVNIIFGDKGSGKSEILSSLRDYYISKNEKFIEFEGGENEKWKKNILQINEDDKILTDFNNKDLVNDNFNYIIKFEDVNPTQLKNYYVYFKNRKRNNNKEKLLILNIEKFLNYNSEGYINLYKELESIDTFFNELDSFSYKKIDSVSVEEVKSILTEFKNKVKKAYKEEWLNENSKILTDNLAVSLNRYVSENTGTPEIPNSTNLFLFGQVRINLKKKSLDFLNLLKLTNSKKKHIGTLGDKGIVESTTDKYFINIENKKSIDSKHLSKNKTDLAKILVNMEKIIKEFNKNNISSIVEEIKNIHDEKNIRKINDFLAINKHFTINDIDYEPSKGELAILSLQHDLLSKVDNKIFLIDEPEVNLGSSYINDVIVPLVIDLAKSKKIIVIATHDANVAVRTRPSNSILKKTSNNIYGTYIGNMFSDKLQNINSSEILSWKEESIKHLEGGKCAFDERGDLYE